MNFLILCLAGELSYTLYKWVLNSGIDYSNSLFYFNISTHLDSFWFQWLLITKLFQFYIVLDVVRNEEKKVNITPWLSFKCQISIACLECPYGKYCIRSYERSLRKQKEVIPTFIGLALELQWVGGVFLNAYMGNGIKNLRNSKWIQIGTCQKGYGRSAVKTAGGKCVGQHLWSFLDLEFIEENFRLTETSNSVWQYREVLISAILILGWPQLVK